MRSFLRPRNRPCNPWAHASTSRERLSVLSSGGGLEGTVQELRLALLLVEDVSSGGPSAAEESGTSLWKVLASALGRECAYRLCASSSLPPQLSLRLRAEHRWSLEEVASFRSGTARSLFGPFGGFTWREDAAGLWEAWGGDPGGFVLYQALDPSPSLSMEGEARLLASALVGVPADLVARLTWLVVPASSVVEELAPNLRRLAALSPAAQRLLAAAYVPQAGALPPPLVEYLEALGLLVRLGEDGAHSLESSAAATGAYPDLAMLLRALRQSGR